MTRQLNTALAEQIAAEAIGRPCPVALADLEEKLLAHIIEAKDDSLRIELSRELLGDPFKLAHSFFHEITHGVGGTFGKCDTMYSHQAIMTQVVRLYDRCGDSVEENFSPEVADALRVWSYKREQATDERACQILLDMNNDRIAAGLCPIEDALVVDLDPAVNPWDKLADDYLQEVNR